MTRTKSSLISAPSRFLVAIAAAMLFLSACGGSDVVISDPTTSDTSTSDTSTSDTATADTASGEVPAAAAEEAAPAAVTQTASLTLSTGETFALVPRSCETQATDPNSLLNDRFFDLSARTADDAFRFSLNGAQSAQSTDPERVIGGLTGERDENGVNPDIDYLVSGPIDANPEITIVVDGARVSGEVLLDAKFSRNKAFGETVIATFEFNCG